MDEDKLTLELVRINSENPPGNEKQIAKFIFDYLEGLGASPEIIEFDKNRTNVVAEIGREKGLMLCGHMDTVPIGDENLWKQNPFGEISRGKVYGRGSSDMKGGIASILTAVGKVNLSKLKRKLLLTFVADEEARLRGSTWLLENRKGIFRDVEYGVIAEPTDMKIQIAQKGVVDIKVKFGGKSAHGSMPWLGENAIVKATKFVTELEKLNSKMKIKDNLLGKGSVNIGKISGGTKVNVVPDYCELEIDRRVVPGETPERVVKQIKEVSRRLKLNAEMEVVLARKPFKLNESSEIVRLVRILAGTKTFGATGYTEQNSTKRKRT